MLENETRGWFGAFSSVGKSSAEKYHLIVNKDEIIGDKPKKKRIFKGDGVFGVINTDKCGDDNMDTIEDNFEIFKFQDENGEEYYQSISRKHPKLGYEPFRKKNQRKCKTALPKERLKYYSKHKVKGTLIKKDTYPDCTKYQPKYSQVKPRLIIGPVWNKTKGHDFNIKQDDSKFYLGHEDLNTQAKHTFCNFGLYTERGDIMKASSVRCQTAKGFRGTSNNQAKETIVPTSRPESAAATISVKEQTITKKRTKRPSTSIRYSTKFTTQPGLLTVGNANDLNYSSSSASDSYDEYKHIYQKQFKTKKIDKTKKIQDQIEKVKIKAPDFGRIISRETLNIREENKKGVIPFSMPNFKHTRERPIMMVVYDKKVHRRRMKNNDIKVFDPSLLYDPYKVLGKINNHTESHATNFNKIKSRPCDNNPLPSYMKQIHTKSTCYLVTEDSLKMNNYADSKFLNTRSSFWPKKSFNKFINLNLLNSNKFLENALGNTKDLKTENDYIAKSMKFYNKNFDDLLKESMLTKFDNVTYKTIRKENKLDSKDVQKFIENYHLNKQRQAKEEDR